jgi:hypothetical protein
MMPPLTRADTPAPPQPEQVRFRRKIVAKKSSCPITRADFQAKARPVTITINNIPMQAEVKEFSTGSLGWYLNGKTTIDIGGTPVSVQIGMNLTIVGSKELPRDGSATPGASEEVA